MTRSRYDQCGPDCTTDCGHCKGKGHPADTRLTEPQRRALAILDEHTVPYGDADKPGMYAKQVAKLLWPDSPAWGKVTRSRGWSRGGAMGGTMPMKAGTLLGRLVRMGLADEYQTDVLQPRWVITVAGRHALHGRDL